MSFPVRLRVAVVALATIVVACSSDSPVAPSASQATTLSQVLSEMTLPALSGVASTLSSAPVTSAATPVPSTCSYSASSQSFSCPTVAMANGLTVTQSYTLLDASGKPQSQFDPGTTAAVRTKMSAAGTVTLTGSTSGTLTIDQQQDMTFSGLLTSTHVLNGLGTVHMSGAISTGTTTTPANSTTTMTTTNLVLPPMNGDAIAWPTSGTLTEDMTNVDAGSPVVVSTHLTMTFNGTSQVAVVITIGTNTQRCTIDMAKTSALACT
jgi:hypothetical protein